MSDFYFDRDTYKNEIEKIYLSAEQKNAISEKARTVVNKRQDLYDKSEKGLKVFYKVWVRAVAAVIAVALIGGIACFSIGNNSNANSFCLVSNAASNTDSQSEIKINSEISDAGFSMITSDENGVEIYRNKQGKKDYFVCYELTDLCVKGKNIDTITFSSNQKSIYFIVDNYSEINLFSHFEPITNSQYTEEEFLNYGDGIYGKFCNGFTYKNSDNPDDEQIIKLGKLIQLVVESDRASGEIDACITEIENATDRINVYKTELYNQTGGIGGGAIPEEIEAEYKIIENNTDEFLKIALENATFDVEVQFRDGSKQTMTFYLGYENTGDGYYWLSIKPVV